MKQSIFLSILLSNLTILSEELNGDKSDFIVKKNITYSHTQFRDIIIKQFRKTLNIDVKFNELFTSIRKSLLTEIDKYIEDDNSFLNSSSKSELQNFSKEISDLNDFINKNLQNIDSKWKKLNNKFITQSKS